MKPWQTVAVLCLLPTSCYTALPEVAKVASADDVTVLVSHPFVSVVIDGGIAGASEKQAAKLERARQLVEQAINNESFRRRALLFSSALYGGRPGDGYLQAEGEQPSPHAVATNAEVIRALLDGNSDDGRIHLYIAVTRERTSLDDFARTPIGVKDGVTSIFPDWLDGAQDAVVAENLVHEHLHRLGFEHEHWFSTRRCASAPYAVGKMVCAVSAGNAVCIPRPPTKC